MAINKDFFKKVLNLNSLEGEPNAKSGDETEAAPAPETVVCKGCKRTIAKDEFKRRLYVCPRCGRHMSFPPRERVLALADEGSFVEFDAGLVGKNILDFPGYDSKLDEMREKTGEPEGVVTGRITISGCPTAIFAMNPDFIMGSMGAAVGEKIARLFEYAADEHLPVIGFTVSGGARMHEGMLSLMQMAKVSGAVNRHSDAGGLYIAVLTDPTCGGVTASFAMQADILVAEPKALIAFAGPRVIEQTIHKKLPDGFQSAEFLLEHGFLDTIIPRQRQRAGLYRLLSLHRREDGSYGRA